MTRSKSQWKDGQWNAYVEAGRTDAEQQRRLTEVPEEWRASVLSHLATVNSIKRLNEQKERRY